MDANQRCRKRKQPFSSSGSSASHPVTLGPSTRSKTVSLFHSNRSDYKRPCNSEPQNFPSPLTVSSKDTAKQYSDEDDNPLIKDLILKSKKNRMAYSVDSDNETSQGLVKDLRLRRVFSLKSSSGFHEKSVEDEKTKEEGSRSALDLDSPLIAENGGCNDKEDVATGELHKGVSSKSLKDNEVTSILSSILEEYRPTEQNGMGLYDDKKKIKQGEVNENFGSFAICETEKLGSPVGNGALVDSEKNKDGVEGQGDLPEEILQATPPDAESFGKLEGLENEKACLVSPLHSAKKVTDCKCVGNATCPDVEKRIEQLTQTKTMFMPRLQRKLFKAPGSFNYRRLLPFLMDITEDNSGSMKFDVDQKDEKDVHKKPIQTSLVSENQNISTDEFQKCTPRPDDVVVARALPEDPSTNSNNLSVKDTPKLTSCQVLPESSKCLELNLDTNNVIHKGGLLILVDEHTKNIEMGCKESLSNKLSAELCKPTPGYQPDKNVADVIPPDEFKCVKHESFRQEGSISSISAGNQFGEENETSHNYCDAKQVIHDGNTESIICSTSKLSNLNHQTPNLSGGKENKMESIVIKRSADPVLSNYVDGWPEELVPVSTHIHAEIQNGFRMEEDNSHRDDMVRGSIDLAPRLALNKSNDFHDTRKCSNTKAKSALNPCSRLKLFKISGSFSYKRLLPYLKEIAEDKTGVSGDNQRRELENGMEGNHTLPISASEYKVFPGEKSATAALALQDELCIDDEVNQASSGNVSNASSLDKSQKFDQFQDQHILSEGNGQLEYLPEPTISSHEISAIQLGDPVKNGCFSRENVVSTCGQISLNHELICTGFHKNSEKFCAGHTNSQDRSLATAFDSPGTIIAASGKGILKRNPRGCRGLCTCLHCTSFRLHAEKAFEFSKNQMLDAEEVAVDLIKQLTSLRKMLERSANADDQSIIHLDQVKDACQKAIEAEELAKLRINQMSEDVNIHCKITEPRVRFSSRVEEIAILKADLPGNSVDGVQM